MVKAYQKSTKNKILNFILNFIGGRRHIGYKFQKEKKKIFILTIQHNANIMKRSRSCQITLVGGSDIWDAIHDF